MFIQRKISISTRCTCLLIFAVLALCAVNGYGQTLKAQLATRPISRDDIAAYKLASTMELTGGLNTVGLGQAVHLEAEVDIGVPPLQIASVTWSLASKPAGSNAALADSPLGTNVPVYPPSDALIYQIAGRKMLRPDVAGIYNVNA